MPVKKPAQIELPKGVKESDTKYTSRPKTFWTNRYTDAQREAWRRENESVHDLRLAYTERFGWCIRTLHISSGKMSQRSYGVEIANGGIVTLGNGPHIKQEITVYVSNKRIKDLQYLVDLYNKGMEGANVCRDRRSTRAAQTRLRRSGFNSMFV